MAMGGMASAFFMLSVNKTSAGESPRLKNRGLPGHPHVTPAISLIRPRNEIPHSGEKRHLNLHFMAGCFLLPAGGFKA
jgi:hypothetical protein